nr:peptide deformylase [uncultured Caproiciproducens sp.]
MALREIRTFNDPILRKKCKTVDAVNSRIINILDDMAETMYHSIGGGLAANQVGILRCLVVVDVGDGLLKLINPEIISTEGLQIVNEGCLSFPDVWGEVKRPKKVTVKFNNENGETKYIDGEGILAQCLCHEIDHLNGTVFIDKVIEFIKL